jgi:hypothetical protein
MREGSNAMKNLIAPFAFAALLLSACAIPGIGPYASEVVERFVGTQFKNPIDPERNVSTGSFYSRVYKGGEWIYRTEPEGLGTRYYIRFYYDRCKYSLYVDQNDTIRSWRDEGGTSHMTKCLLR